MKIDCLTCGIEVGINNTKFMVNPGFIIVPCEYATCDEHKDIFYDYDDVYDIEGNRKDINHEEVVKRCRESK